MTKVSKRAYINKLYGGVMHAARECGNAQEIAEAVMELNDASTGIGYGDFNDLTRTIRGRRAAKNGLAFRALDMYAGMAGPVFRVTERPSRPVFLPAVAGPAAFVAASTRGIEVAASVNGAGSDPRRKALIKATLAAASRIRKTAGVHEAAIDMGLDVKAPIYGQVPVRYGRGVADLGVYGAHPSDEFMELFESTERFDSLPEDRQRHVSWGLANQLAAGAVAHNIRTKGGGSTHTGDRDMFKNMAEQEVAAELERLSSNA